MPDNIHVPSDGHSFCSKHGLRLGEVCSQAMENHRLDQEGAHNTPCRHNNLQVGLDYSVGGHALPYEKRWKISFREYESDRQHSAPIVAVCGNGRNKPVTGPLAGISVTRDHFARLMMPMVEGKADPTSYANWHVTDLTGQHDVIFPSCGTEARIK